MSQDGAEWPDEETDGEWTSNDPETWSYERLRSVRATASRLLGSGMLWLHEQMHVREVIRRLDAAVHLKQERDAYQAEKAARAGDSK